MLLVTFLLNQGRLSGFVKFSAWEAPMLTTAHLIAMALRRGREEATTPRRRRCVACSSRTLATIAWKADRVLLLSGARIGRPPCSRGHGLKTDARPSHEPPLPYTPLSTPPGHHQSPTTNKQPPTTNHQLWVWWWRRFGGWAYWGLMRSGPPRLRRVPVTMSWPCEAAGSL